ncbi:MAG TPA: DNA translocase FtsK [Candidatus Dormibacteraeota bacterium]|nr:DNA translocase FtsK [Candidatus Dormibacteraeota bacterium]
MARSAPPRPSARRSTPARRRPSAAARRRPPARKPRPPLLTPDQRRELGGVAAIGLGLILAAVLALPGGGSIASRVHDWLFATFGAGAWLAAAGFVVAGVRVLGRRGWTGGLLGALGSLVTVFASLGFLGLAAPGSAGVVGQHLGPGIGARLGDAATAASMLVLACLGLVLAVELRVGRIAAAVAAWWAEQREAQRVARESEPQVQTAAEPARQLRGRAVRTGEAVPGAPARAGTPVPALLPVDAPPLPPLLPTDDLDFDLEKLRSQPDPEPEVAHPAVPGPVEPFQREFEGLPIDAGLAAAARPEKPELGEVPDVALAHAGEVVEEPEKLWVLPSSDLLDTVTGKRERLEQEVRATSVAIERTLQSFGVEAHVRGVNSGPTVTQYELQPGPGVPVRKIVNHQTDLALALAAPIRIQAPIPGKAAIGVEVPNKAAQLVTLKQVVQSPGFSDARNRLAVALGADVSGHPVVGDLARMPHLLVAGATGSGKSVCINAILGGFLLQHTPNELKLILIDPKRVELSGFADIPHLLVPVVVEPEAAVASLRWAVREMEERYKLFASHGARNIAAFNERAPGLGLQPLPYIVTVVDELADLMMVAAGEIEDLICRIAQLARAVGIHLIVATQRPSADIITGLIKANIPSRVAFAVSSGVDSRVILDEMGAEKLLGRGDMLYLPIDEGKPRRLQGAFVSDRELDALITHWKQQGRPEYQEEIFHVEATVSWARDAGKRDPLFAKAAHCVAAEGRAAASLLQRKLNVGYTRAARLVDQLAEHRVVGPYEGSKSREVLMDVIQVDELLADLGEE